MSNSLLIVLALMCCSQAVYAANIDMFIDNISVRKGVVNRQPSRWRFSLV